MNDVCRIWNSPWHAWQCTLAQRLATEARERAVAARGVAVGSGSWLDRIRVFRTVP